jgi:hypothetical protein
MKRQAAGALPLTETTEYRGELVLLGRWQFCVKGGKLAVTDTLGRSPPRFQRPKGQPGTIAVNLDNCEPGCLS